MQDDVFLVGSDGWVDAAKPRAAIDNKERDIRETPDFVVDKKKYKMDLIPPALIVARYFPREQAEVDELEAKREAAERELEEFVEENSGEDGPIEDAKTDKGTATKASISERLKQIKSDKDSENEKKALTRCLELIETEAAASKAVKEAQAALDAKVLKQYGKLSETEIKTLVEDKWFASIWRVVEGELQRVTQVLASRVKELDERYAVPFPKLEREVDELSAKVGAHLKRMGVELA